MTSLAQIQETLCAGLNPFGSDLQRNAAAKIIDLRGSLTNIDRLHVYQRNISGAHLAVLEQIYPVCRMILGERPFATLARKYTWHYPKISPDLNIYGEHFPAFLSNQDNQLDSLPYIEDLARLEYLWHQSWFAADKPAFDFAAFKQASDNPDRILFHLSPGLHLIHSPWPILALWEKHTAGENPLEIRAQSRPDELVIHRMETDVKIHRVSEDEYGLLQAIANGRTLNQLVTETKTRNAVDRLPGLIAQNWICGFSVIEPVLEDAQ